MFSSIFITNKTSIDNNSKRHIFEVFVLLLLSQPFVIRQLFPLPSGIKILFFFCALFGLEMMICNKRLINTRLLFVFIIQIISWAFFMLFHGDRLYIDRIIFLLFSCEFFILFYKEELLRSFLRVYNNIILLMAIGGVIAFFLVLFGVLQPLFEYINIDGRSGYFFGFTFTNTYFGNIIRYAGLFDEPGAMAYWGMFAIIINKLFFKNSKYEIVLAMCLCFTFSLAFFIQILVYILLFHIDIHNFKNTILVLLLITGISFCFYKTKDTSFDLYEYTFKRLEIDESTGLLEGDNRTELADNAKDIFINNPIMGIGPKTASEFGTTITDNPFETLAVDGIVGTIITYLPLLLLLFLNFTNKSIIIKIVIILAIGYAQRPFHYNCLHYLMLFSLYKMVLIEKANSNMSICKNIHKQKIIKYA